jgi:formate hydrogenlyase subunit 6/NADH:ubiquinone oxidoreductase subunit I
MPMDVLDRILRPLRRGSVTSRYPAGLPELPPTARGLPELDASLCDGNAACVAACPTGAIHVEPGTWSIDAGACVFCAACARVCPTAAIRLGSRVELATDQRDQLVITISRSERA